ncbi:amidohydrolase 2 [Cyathus striatus]|nr:amidohydrolase 2 [Cyathus striatus]
MQRIDIHQHFFPDDLLESKKAANKGLGWRTPDGTLPWDPDVILKAMDAMKIDVAILSLPALAEGTVSFKSRHQARKWNTSMSQICNRYPGRFGFFAALPFLDDVEGVLKEIKCAFDELMANGIALSSCYGSGSEATYVGSEKYDRIWEELDARKAVVFLHGAQIPSSTPCPHPYLGVPITEVPNETFKAAAHLVVTGKKQKYSNVRIILAHSGGTTMALASRVAVLSRHMGCPMTEQQILNSFKTFFYDTALSAYDPNLASLEEFVGIEQILFGTDFPAVSKDMTEWFTARLEERYRERKDDLKKITRDNAIKLFPRLQR